MRELLTPGQRGDVMIVFKLAPGKGLIFSYQRLTHGRTAVDLDAGKDRPACSVDLKSGTRGYGFSAPGETIHVSG